MSTADRLGGELEVRVLGSLEVVDDAGRFLAIRGARLTCLLVALALRSGEVVSDDRLSEILWGDEPPDGPNALRRQVSTLRSVLGRVDAVVRRGSGYVLCIDKDAVDALRFERLAGRGHEALRGGDVMGASVVLREALGLWRGDALVDVVDEPFAEAERVRLTETKVAAIEARIDADLALGRHAALVAELEHLVAAYPWREHLRAQLMLALSRSGRQTEALRSYESARSVLADQVGLAPSPELRALETAILRQDDTTVRRDAQAVLSPRRFGLRTPLTSLVGRRDLLDALAARLRRRRLVTLVGPGGVGKTRLAIEAAHQMLETEMLEVWLVELADLADGDAVASAVATALGLPISADAKSDLARIVDFLSGRSTLIVLDNCEHVIDSAAHLAQELLEACPTVRVLATSRERLGVPGEVICPVPPLPLSDAVALFVERGYATASASELVGEDDLDWPLLESICARLDGLPLAIELAASRLSSMPLAELAVGLDDRFRLLSRGARTARPRQQTLRAVVDWSYDLLFDDERRVFDRLSVFTGGCDLAAARVVCSDDAITPDDVTELLTRLADKSLIAIEAGDGAGRMHCRMLETLVEYGRDRLAASGEAARVRAAHGGYYCDLALASMAALKGMNQRRWLRTIAANMGNLRAVFEAATSSGDRERTGLLAGALGWYWWFTGRAVEGASWLTAAHSRPGDAGDVTVFARVLAWAAFTRAPGFVLWGDVDELAPIATPSFVKAADELRIEALARYRMADVPDELAGIATALAVTYSARGDHARAQELLFEAEGILAGLDAAPWARALLAFVSGRRAFVEGRHREAEEALCASIPLLESVGGEVHSSFAYRYIGRLAARRGDYEASVQAIEAALRLARDLGLSAFANVLLIDLAASMAAMGRFDHARAVLATPLASARDQRSSAGVREALTALAWVEWQAGNVQAAARLAWDALQVDATAYGEEAIVHCSVILGLAAERDGDTTDARACHRQALDLAGRTGEPRLVALVLEGFATVAVRDGEADWAARLLGAAATLRQSLGGAAGWGFAPIGPVDVEDVKSRVREIIGAAPAAAAYSSGAEDPQSVVTDADLIPAR
jgi:predicted ATPase/DNA-binding SARP family transcriptional activator